MSDAQTRRIGVSWEPKPHAYDPASQPEYFEGVLARRMVAFCIDFLVLTLPMMAAAIVVFFFGILTLGLGWLLFWLFPAVAVVWALAYYGFCFAGPASATLGMRAVDLEMRTWYGGPGYFLLGAAHAVVFYVTVSALTPLVLLVALLNSRGRLLHDILLGTVVINNEARARALRRPVRAV